MARRRLGGRGKTSELADLAAKSYWRAVDARRALSAWEKSGEPMTAFAKAHGLKASRLAWWRKRLGAEKPTASRCAGASTEAVRFLPVVAVGGADACDEADTTRPQPAPIELVLPSGHVVRVAAGFDAGELSRLLDVLEAR